MTLVVAILLAIFVLPSPWGYVAVAAATVVEVAEVAAVVWYSKRRRAVVGAEALLGVVARVVAECRPEGRVRVHGELWRARCEAGAAEGDEVVVREVDGLTLVVEPRLQQSVANGR